MLRIAVVSSQKLNLDPSGQVEKVVLHRDQGKDIGFHNNSQEKYVLFNQNSGEVFFKSPYRPCYV